QPGLSDDRRPGRDDRAGGSGMSLAADLGIAFGRVAFVMMFVLNTAAILGWVERKQSAIMQDRIGGNRASIFGFRALGLFHPLAFILFLTAGIAATKRIPFDFPEGESEIIGYNVEYSGMKFGMFLMTDMVETTVLAGLCTALFLGGWQVPYLFAGGFHFPWGAEITLRPLVVTLLQVGAFVTKVAVMIFILMLIRWTLPRFRYDQAMRLGWLGLFPLSILNIVLTGAVLLAWGDHP